ncbi:hypothetical protein HU200_050106 [Digitaria exilis]|uniref:Uncharacterized protein n=1 Tax=Digitaria exilis TaxID=1010633 RepID=A0A835ARN1_9POAL|nr:hypothetical protein HU200_050106 [Digitaria exilis]
MWVQHVMPYISSHSPVVFFHALSPRSIHGRFPPLDLALSSPLLDPCQAPAPPSIAGPRFYWRGVRPFGGDCDEILTTRKQNVWLPCPWGHIAAAPQHIEARRRQPLLHHLFPQFAWRCRSDAHGINNISSGIPKRSTMLASCWYLSSSGNSDYPLTISTMIASMGHGMDEAERPAGDARVGATDGRAACAANLQQPRAKLGLGSDKHDGEERRSANGKKTGEERGGPGTCQVHVSVQSAASLMWTRLNKEREARRRFVRRRHRLKLPCDSPAPSARCRISSSTSKIYLQQDTRAKSLARTHSLLRCSSVLCSQISPFHLHQKSHRDSRRRKRRQQHGSCSGFPAASASRVDGRSFSRELQVVVEGVAWHGQGVHGHGAVIGAEQNDMEGMRHGVAKEASIATISKLPFPPPAGYITNLPGRSGPGPCLSNHAMASNSSSQWTKQEDKMFERALAEVRRHYQLLVEDVAKIESGGVPFHWYAASPPPSTLQREELKASRRNCAVVSNAPAASLSGYRNSSTMRPSPSSRTHTVVDPPAQALPPPLHTGNPVDQPPPPLQQAEICLRMRRLQGGHNANAPPPHIQSWTGDATNMPPTKVTVKAFARLGTMPAARTRSCKQHAPLASIMHLLEEARPSSKCHLDQHQISNTIGKEKGSATFYATAPITRAKPALTPPYPGHHGSDLAWRIVHLYNHFRAEMSISLVDLLVNCGRSGQEVDLLINCGRSGQEWRTVRC